ncbi:MAG: MotA/TolQ/ExbB proton channel family protein [Thermoguttaceae bacterium]|nr:MotA/TolQ/ExbB proton channel family protein [Thermoguttaceae bacterium]
MKTRQKSIIVQRKPSRRRRVALFVAAAFFASTFGFAPSSPFSPTSPNSVFAAAVSQSDEPLDLSVLDAPTSAPADTAPVSAPSADAGSGVENGTPADAASSPESTAANASNGGERSKLLELVLAGGWIGVVLLVASIIAVSLAIRLALALRRSVFFSPELETAVADALARNDFAAALAAAEERNDAGVGRVLAAGLRETDRGWAAVEKGLEDAVAEETAAFYRRTEPLATIGNVAPMLGLLGTVVGMVSTFGELAVADGSGRNLAGGIYFALVTTVDGLLVAIPVLVAHSVLNARGASRFAELIQRLDRLFASSKRLLTPENSANSTNSTRPAQNAPTRPTSQTPSNAPNPQNAQTARTTQSAQTAQTSRSPQNAAPPAAAPAPPASDSTTRRPTSVRGLEEVVPTPARPALSLKSKPDADADSPR